uniref:Uncharacterized protein n=1 Tax=Oryza punctata TaxID=4537 RepID=A0A0E0MNU8_ORYPU
MTPWRSRYQGRCHRSSKKDVVFTKRNSQEERYHRQPLRCSRCQLGDPPGESWPKLSLSCHPPASLLDLAKGEPRLDCVALTTRASPVDKLSPQPNLETPYKEGDEL